MKQQAAKKILIITGTYPPERCGAGDYVYNLFQTEEAKDWDLFYSKDWSLGTFSSKVKEIKKMKPNIINIQYPTMGYGLSVLPHLLCLYFRCLTRTKVTVTIHENSQLGWKAKAASIIYMIFANKLIFTNKYELDYSKRFNPLFLRGKSTVIKIFSNIKAAETLPSIENRKYDLGYFGYIRLKKGLEDFVEVARALKKEKPDLKIYIMGQIQPEYKEYYDSLFGNQEQNNIELILNKDAEEVSTILADTKLMYLPFPDGVSERRGSFLAAIKNLCLILTTKGIFTTQAHEKMCFFANKEDAKVQVENILAYTTEELQVKQKQVMDFIQNEIPQSWSEVAKSYNEFLLKQ